MKNILPLLMFSLFMTGPFCAAAEDLPAPLFAVERPEVTAVGEPPITLEEQADEANAAFEHVCMKGAMDKNVIGAAAKQRDFKSFSAGIFRQISGGISAGEAWIHVDKARGDSLIFLFTGKDTDCGIVAMKADAKHGVDNFVKLMEFEAANGVNLARLPDTQRTVSGIVWNVVTYVSSPKDAEYSLVWEISYTEEKGITQISYSSNYLKRK